MSQIMKPSNPKHEPCGQPGISGLAEFFSMIVVCGLAVFIGIVIGAGI